MPRGVKTDGVAETEQPELSAPFDAEIGLVYTAVTPDGVTAELTVTPKLRQPMGIVHGGVWCSVVESLASVSAYTWLSANGGGNVVGVNNNTDFLHAVTEGTVYASSEPVHRGRRQQLWLVTVRDGGGRTIARGQVRLQNLELV
jgi:uncharacterized protein (TIGR00369 family)